MAKWKNNQVKVKTNKDVALKQAKREKQLNVKEKKIERYNGNDPKSLKPRTTFWAYKSFSFIAKSHNLIMCL